MAAGAPAQPEFRSAVWPGLGPGKELDEPSSAPGLACTTTTTYFATCWGIAWPGWRTASSTPRPMIRAPATAWSFFPATLPRAPRASADSASETWPPRSRICKLLSRRPMPLLLPALLTPVSWDRRSTASRACWRPTYQTPRSLQMNIGLQKQFWQTTLFSVDYVRNVGTHYLIGYDTNHVGDASAPEHECGVECDQQHAGREPAERGVARPPTSAGRQFADRGQLLPGAVPGASIADFASHGLDSGGQFLGGAPASLFGLTPDTGAAFPGINPLVGRNTMFFPAGRSLYSGVQVSLRTHLTNPVRGVRRRKPAVFLHPLQLSQQLCGRDRRSGPAAAGGGFQPPHRIFRLRIAGPQEPVFPGLGPGPAPRHPAGPDRASGFASAPDSLSSRQWRSRRERFSVPM